MSCELWIICTSAWQTPRRVQTTKTSAPEHCLQTLQLISWISGPTQSFFVVVFGLGASLRCQWIFLRPCGTQNVSTANPYWGRYLNYLVIKPEEAPVQIFSYYPIVILCLLWDDFGSAVSMHWLIECVMLPVIDIINLPIFPETWMSLCVQTMSTQFAVNVGCSLLIDTFSMLHLIW